jgi:DNA-binding CsgD family transcriptional regulator
LAAPPQPDATPTPVVVIVDDGPATPSLDERGRIVVSGDTPLATIVDCLVADPADLEQLPEWRGDAGADAELGLTAREREVLELLAAGLSPVEIARRLAITTHTARDHIKAIRRKLDRPTIMAAVLEAIRLGVLRLDAA